MEHFVPLDRLPDGLKFPEDLTDRIRYDPVGRRLFFSGFMSKGEFDRLNQLSEDWSYRRPLEDLFRLSTSEKPRPGVFGRVLSQLGLF